MADAVRLRTGRRLPRGHALRKRLRFLSERALLLVGALLLAAAVGTLIALRQPQAAVGVALVLPVGALVLRNPFMAVILWALIVPYFLEALTADVSAPVWALHRIGLPATLALVAVYHGLGIRRSPFRFGWIDVAAVAFVALCVANVLIYGINTQRELVSFYDKLFVPMVLFWLVRAIGPTRRDIQLLVGVGLLTIVVQVGIGIMSWVAPSLLPGQWLGRAGERTVGTFGGPAPYTITIVFFVLLAIHTALRGKRPLLRTFVFGLVLAALIAIFLSLSRGSWLGAGIAFAGLGILYPRVVGTVAVTGLLLAAALAFGPLGEQIAIAQQRLDDASTVETRILTNDAAIRIIQDRPLLGVGYGNFERYDEQYKERVGDVPLRLGGSIHNTYLNLAAELGLPAAILYFLIPLGLMLKTLMERARLRRGDWMAWGLCIVLWLSLLDQFVVSNFLEMIHAYLWGTSLWWLTLGLLAVVLQRAETGQRRPRIRGHAAWRPAGART